MGLRIFKDKHRSCGGLPANTGGAGARYRVACFAGTPASTGDM